MATLKEMYDNVDSAVKDAQKGIVCLYMQMQVLSSTKFNSERRQLKDMLGDLRIMEAKFEQEFGQ